MLSHIILISLSISIMIFAFIRSEKFFKKNEKLWNIWILTAFGCCLISVILCLDVLNILEKEHNQKQQEFIVTETEQEYSFMEINSETDDNIYRKCTIDVM